MISEQKMFFIIVIFFLSCFGLKWMGVKFPHLEAGDFDGHHRAANKAVNSNVFQTSDDKDNDKDVHVAAVVVKDSQTFYIEGKLREVMPYLTGAKDVRAAFAYGTYSKYEEKNGIFPLSK